jgi:hypothetical protein
VPAGRPGRCRLSVVEVEVAGGEGGILGAKGFMRIGQTIRVNEGK